MRIYNVGVCLPIIYYNYHLYLNLDSLLLELLVLQTWIEDIEYYLFGMVVSLTVIR